MNQSMLFRQLPLSVRSMLYIMSALMIDTSDASLRLCTLLYENIITAETPDKTGDD